MTEEIKDQAQTETQKAETQKKEQSDEKKLPETGFFRGQKMSKYYDDLELEGEQSKEKTEKKETPKKEETVKKEEVKAEEKKEEKKEDKKPPEETKPYKVLKVDGRDHPVKSEDELLELAQKGVDYTQKRQRDAEWERDLKTQQDKLDKLAPVMVEIAEAVRSGKLTLPKKEEKDEILDNEDIDPEVRPILKKIKDENESLKSELAKIKDGQSESNVERLKVELEKTVEDSRKEFPFEEIVDGDGKNITKNFFAGIVSSKVNDDLIAKQQDSAFVPRSLAEIIKETAKEVKGMEDYYKGKYGGQTSEKKEMTAELLASEYPDQVKKLVDDGVAKYLEEQEATPPAARSTTRETKPEQKKEVKGNVKDAMKRAAEDGVLDAAMDEIGKTFGL